MTLEELVIDDSFDNYCFGRNQDDILYWENFITEHPEHQKKIEQAKRLVLGLHTAIKEVEEKTNSASEAKVVQFQQSEKRNTTKRIYRYVIAAAMAIGIVFGGIHFLRPNQTIDKTTAHNVTSDTQLIYTTALGQRQNISLSDGTNIWLNAGSELRIDADYGKKDRKVFLTGEALFNVVHDENLPFTVYSNGFQVIDLGTVFNVKAYPGDPYSEASLIEGKIQIRLSDKSEMISLKPNQKIVIKDNNHREINDDRIRKEADIVQNIKAETKIVPLNYMEGDNTPVETSWVDRLEIDNESFLQMKEKMERWYGVKISIEDAGVGQYPFTATFKNEKIEDALKALQYAYPFNFKIERNEVTITK